MKRLARISLVVDLEAVDPALARLVVAASDHLSGNRLLCFELAVIEALTNAIRHGGPRPVTARLEVELTVSKGELAVTIRDSSGKPIGPELFAVPMIQSADPLAEGGRGLHIMRSCSDRIDFQRVDGTNVLTMAFLTAEGVA